MHIFGLVRTPRPPRESTRLLNRTQIIQYAESAILILTVHTVVALFLPLISVITVLHLNSSRLSAGC